MKYLVYIVFFVSGIAFGQQDSISKILQGRLPSLNIIPAQPYNIVARPDPEFMKILQAPSPHITEGTGRPNATFLQTQGQMPNLNIVRGNPNDFYNTYSITEADRDSVYAAVFNWPIVQAAIKAKFKGKSKLYEKGYEIELVSLLIIDSISNETKNKLLTGRILADWQYDEENGRPKGWEVRSNLKDVVNLNGNELTIITEGTNPGKEDRNRALVDFVVHHLDLNFSRILYVIDGNAYQAKDIKSLQQLLESLKKAEIQSVLLLTGAKASSIFGSHAANGLIIISSKN